MATHWDGKERRDNVVLSADEIERMLEECAERGAEKAVQSFYAQIGEGIVKKTLLVAGALMAAVLAWVNSAITFHVGGPK
jgi:hypothetical protein